MIGRFPGVVGGLAALVSRLLAQTDWNDTAASKSRGRGDDSEGEICDDLEHPAAKRRGGRMVVLWCLRWAGSLSRDSFSGTGKFISRHPTVFWSRRPFSFHITPPAAHHFHCRSSLKWRSVMLLLFHRKGGFERGSAGAWIR
jgi:hypothetical protein